MRKLFVLSMFAAICLAVTAPAMATYFWPGRIIIGYPGGGGTTTTTTSSSAASMAAMDEGCVLEKELECECMPGKPVLQACQMTGVDTGCLKPEMPILGVVQKSDVVKVGKDLGSVICGKIDETAYIYLPPPF